MTSIVLLTQAFTMRIVSEITNLPFRVTIFSWNNKYIIKCEYGPLEQTYKIAESDVLGGLKELQSQVESEDFINKVMPVFEQMADNVRIFY